MRDLIENSFNVPKLKSGFNSIFSCCKQNMKKIDVGFNYNFKQVVNDVRKHTSVLKNKIQSSVTNSENKYFNELYNDVDSYLDNKVEYLFQINQIDSKLKDEVDKYWEYFNVKKIVTKQESKIKKQNRLIEALEDSSIQNDCIICMDSERNVIFTPCLHFICCETCSFGKIGNDCPQCHTKIENKKLTLG